MRLPCFSSQLVRGVPVCVQNKVRTAGRDYERGRQIHSGRLEHSQQRRFDAALNDTKMDFMLYKCWIKFQTFTYMEIYIYVYTHIKKNKYIDICVCI